jgi:protein-S-isoprenylcysteine O-methyltransferase Ste14
MNAPKRTTPRGLLLIAGQFGFLLALVLVPAEPSTSTLQRGIGSALMVAAVAILIFAAIALRPALTVTPEPRARAPFITGGIYRYIRHPMYSAVMMIGIGLYLNKPSTLMMILLLGLMLVMYAKASYEDSLLRARWPEAKAYQARTGAFFPKIF